MKRPSLMKTEWFSYRLWLHVCLFAIQIKSVLLSASMLDNKNKVLSDTDVTFPEWRRARLKIITRLKSRLFLVSVDVFS